MKKLISFALAMAMCLGIANAQETKLTKEQILSMSFEELSELPLEDLMTAVQTLELSSVDELFSMIMNKNVSSASKKEENSFVSPLSSTVITRNELREYGISTIEEAFRLIPGMIVSERTNGLYDVQMRGLSNIPDNNMLLYTENQNILLMIDGRISNNYAFGSAFFDVLPISIEDIERIEVVRGANSALYGANAVNGIINIITEKPGRDSQLVSGSIQMGNMSTSVGDIAIRHNINDKLSVGMTANLQLRRRPINELYVMPAEGLYLAKDDASAPAGTQTDAAGLAQMISDATLTDVSKGGYYSTEEIERIRQLYTTDNKSFTIYDAVEPQTPINKMFDDPGLARNQAGINGYVSFAPNKDIRFDLSGGYQQSTVTALSVNSDIFPYNVRNSKTAYGNLNADVYGVRVNVNYLQGPHDYCVGNPGFEAHTYNFNGSIEYDIDLGNLGIRPGLAYSNVRYKDVDPGYYDANLNGVYDSDDPAERLVNFFGTPSGGELQEAKLTNVAASLRLDYRVGGLRVIAAVRGDKSNIPDKWNPSYQGVIGYSINDNNYIRAVYGHAMRSANVVQASSKYCWQRTNMMAPTQIEFTGNEDADLMQINNFELGYRWKPTKTVLVDAEFFYSMSKDYGEYCAIESQTMLYHNDFMQIMNQLMGGGLDMAAVSSMLKSKTYIQYQNMPFKVNQMGFGVNVDWIISNKLIAKVNANIQNTTIDDYYQYDQQKTIRTQLLGAAQSTAANLPALVQEVGQGIDEVLAQGGSLDDYFNAFLGYTPIQAVSKRYEAMTDAQKQEYLAGLMNAYKTGTSFDGIERPLGTYYSLKYGARYDRATNTYYLNSTQALEPELSNDHKHKATPNVYGMFGLIYKPLDILSVSAFANYIGEREYATSYGVAKLDDRFTVNMKIGYRPVDGFEVFFNAHNLLNSKKREFIYCDEIGGLYTFGINFGF